MNTAKTRGALSGRSKLRVPLALLLCTGGCDKIRNALNAEAVSGSSGDLVWQSDSTMLASKPAVLFRVFDHDEGRAVAPVATYGAQGFRRLTMGARGWRAFDINYLQRGRTLSAIRDGRVVGDVQLTRGMWEAGTQLDSVPRCPMTVPAGLVEAPSDVRLAMAGSRPTLKSATALSSGELQQALASIPTLIAPANGIPASMLPRYAREVHVLATGTGHRPTIVVLFNDPEQVPDTLKTMGQRPRQFIVVLDKGVYGYRPSYTFSTLGNALSDDRLAYLDFTDVDADGQAELFFTFTRLKKYHATVILRFENDIWREVFRELLRCQA